MFRYIQEPNRPLKHYFHAPVFSTSGIDGWRKPLLWQRLSNTKLLELNHDNVPEGDETDWKLKY